jgi:hypothetical protein
MAAGTDKRRWRKSMAWRKQWRRNQPWRNRRNIEPKKINDNGMKIRRAAALAIRAIKRVAHRTSDVRVSSVIIVGNNGAAARITQRQTSNSASATR